MVGLHVQLVVLLVHSFRDTTTKTLRFMNGNNRSPKDLTLSGLANSYVLLSATLECNRCVCWVGFRCNALLEARVVVLVCCNYQHALDSMLAFHVFLTYLALCARATRGRISERPTVPTVSD